MAQAIRTTSEHETERPRVSAAFNHIRRRLREPAPEWDYIHTHFGHGYRLEPERAERGPQRGRAR